MPKIRLNKAVKEFNISMSRLVEFLQSRGFVVESNPNAQLEEAAYSALEAEFAKDGEQRKASHEVVITKVPEEKLEIEEKKTPEVIRAKANIKPETKVLGKIDLDPKKPEAEEAPADFSTPAVEEKKEVEPVSDHKPAPEKQEFKVLDKIDLSQIESRNRPVKKDKPKVEEKKAEEKPAEQPVKESPKAEPVQAPADTKPEQPAAEPESQEPQKIETVYQKLDGPKIVGEKIDLSQFADKSKGAGAKKKRKRIEKPGSNQPNTGNTQGGNNNQGNRPQGQGGNNRPQGQNGGPGNRPPGQGGQGGNRFGNNQGNRPQGQGGGFKKGGQNNRPGQRVMPVELTDEQVKNQIKETLEKLTNKGGKSKSSKHRKDKRTFRREQDERQQELEAQDRTLKVTEFITVGELASLMNVSPTEVISACFSLGVMVTMNQRLEADTLLLVADEFGYKIEFSDADLEDSETEEIVDSEEDLVPRAPIVTVMGHVDHGKTSLLDYVRKTNVIAGESGGITQHIGAYNVKLENGQRITFLDTPGHEAFTAMRARGAQITDIAIIVIAADDDVMPQTKEAISHAQAAGVPMIIALNKVDKPNANPDNIRQQLSGMNILVEEWGGNVQSQEISAKFGNNVDLLLEKVLLQAELLELKANPDRNAQGVVIEASLDKGRGYVSTMLVQSGTLRVGDYVLAGKNHGKVKAMLDERGKNLAEAGPSIPVTILGLDGAPTAGDKFKVYEDESEAKSIANKREQLQRELSIRTKKHTTLEELGRRIALGDFKELNIILKGDVDGSVEALSDQLQRLSTAEINVNILHKGVGPITESDVNLAAASDAIIIGFNVRAGGNARELADREEIEIRTYSVIYAAIEEVKEAMEGMLSPEIKEQVIGNVEIREVFKISKVGTIAGCMVLSGKVARNSKIRVLRDGIVKFDGELESLKRFKDDVKEVTKGYECGLNLKGYNDIEVGDILEVYEEVAVKKKLK
ncbi:MULTISPECIES: translation initiation factor IF-2 [Chryseobacterium]|uniref:Translation initiation factor IF-2 n=1 Tax=Chryseobacterium camelliae TaxID=1265445 RepID=A0ABU0TND0_9FLAO|nr:MULTISPECIES: translation initiation factor IF-2 [Chryseobacterium]MDT3407602.1 translation initiation factor IF-2 [Pseudacidovorax intermedius]MDQ1098545.1 translation initiation factor IF-2 [Chryseobacterium camelliae]MDQ1102469.1 translation initiation factor IF-2 [Chryseobacterium sp. SORGH_AS_1048]MDR6085903.1 translation initiation factor IF-2 [Chryseobacterium sp. SORGH_AS_0909]MDR6130269.1 translation initiation factor IF-2 [Chryseobacterium sp. SORGH_AS_1175]